MVICGAKPKTHTYEEFEKAVLELQQKSIKKSVEKTTA